MREDKLHGYVKSPNEKKNQSCLSNSHIQCLTVYAQKFKTVCNMIIYMIDYERTDYTLRHAWLNATNCVSCLPIFPFTIHIASHVRRYFHARQLLKMACPTDYQEVAGSILRSGIILSLKLIIKSFLRSFYSLSVTGKIMGTEYWLTA